MDKSILECQRSYSNLHNEKPLIRREIGSNRALSWVRNCFFHSNLSSYNIRFQFRIVDLVNFNFNFGFLLSFCSKISL